MSVLVLTIPQNVPTGCYVPIAAVATVNGNSIVSNIATLPIHAGGGACSDPQLGYDGDQISTLNGQGTVRSGFVIVSQVNGHAGVISGAAAIFQKSSAVSSVSGCNCFDRSLYPLADRHRRIHGNNHRTERRDDYRNRAGRISGHAECDSAIARILQCDSRVHTRERRSLRI